MVAGWLVGVQPYFIIGVVAAEEFALHLNDGSQGHLLSISVSYIDVGGERSWNLANGFTRIFLDGSDVSIFAILRLLSGQYNIRLILDLTIYFTISQFWRIGNDSDKVFNGLLVIPVCTREVDPSNRFDRGLERRQYWSQLRLICLAVNYVY